MKPTHKRTRRDALILSGAGAAGAMTGCGKVASHLLPMIVAAAVKEIVQIITKHFTKSGGWQPGETATDSSYSTMHEISDQELLQNFKKTAATHITGPLKSPVFQAVKEACGTHIGYAQIVSRNNWLLTGPQKRVYFIAHDWVQFLVEKDSCDLQVVAHTTTPQDCWNKDCKARLTIQKFRYPNGDPETIHQLTGGLSKEVIDHHWAHSDLWKGCPQVGGGGNPLQQDD